MPYLKEIYYTKYNQIKSRIERDFIRIFFILFQNIPFLLILVRFKILTTLELEFLLHFAVYHNQLK